MWGRGSGEMAPCRNRVIVLTVVLIIRSGNCSFYIDLNTVYNVTLNTWTKYGTQTSVHLYF